LPSWSEDAARNRELWTKSNAEYTDPHALASWNRDPKWGMWNVPDAELGIFGGLAGLEVVELGCGTAYVSAWLVRAGARAVGGDITPAQLETARRCMRETGIEFQLVEADAGATGLPDECADLVVSEYGASIWVDPYRWIPEAARLLRVGGRLAFMCNDFVSAAWARKWPSEEIWVARKR
jgi:ubiquinone/menaquinone biosynthesis C-methylase UbiE